MNFIAKIFVFILVSLVLVTILLAAVFLNNEEEREAEANFSTFVCEDPGTETARCVKNKTLSNDLMRGLNACKLTCGLQSALWPAVSEQPILGTSLSRFTIKNIDTTSITCPYEVRDLTSQSLKIFKNHLEMYHPDYDQTNETAPWTNSSDSSIEEHVLKIEIIFGSAEDRLSLTTDESYTLTINSTEDQTKAVIFGVNFFGIRHGLETLSQLINYDEDNDCLQMVNSVEFKDTPAFPYRGLQLDTARNYINIKGIKRTIDAMSGSKLNTFHWHITDSQSFPFVMDSLPKMHEYGAYSEKKVYTTSDIQEIVEYARVRGIRVLPELDAPAHVGYGWQWGPTDNLGNFTVCFDETPWSDYCDEPPCGQLNIANPNMYDVLAKVYQEYVTAFGPLELFHFGGTEINLECWNSSEEIKEWMMDPTTGSDGSLSDDAYYKQWRIFQDSAYHHLRSANDSTGISGILRTSTLTTSDQFNLLNEYILQIWTEGKDSVVRESLEKGYDVIFSNNDSLYLNCGFGDWIKDQQNSCGEEPYREWQKIYDNDLYALAGGDYYKDQILGGEAVLSTEQTDDQNLDSRLWPRLSALGERLWTNPDSNWEQAEYRLVHHRERLVLRGVMAESVQPEYCHINEGSCTASGIV